MTLNDYQELAQRTSSTRLPSAKIENGVLGLRGESGHGARCTGKPRWYGLRSRRYSHE